MDAYGHIDVGWLYFNLNSEMNGEPIQPSLDLPELGSGFKRAQAANQW